MATGTMPTAVVRVRQVPQTMLGFSWTMNMTSYLAEIGLSGPFQPSQATQVTRTGLLFPRVKNKLGTRTAMVQ